MVKAAAVDVTGPVREHAFVRQHDLTYIEGYSDKREQLDEDARLRRAPSVTLTHRLQWVTMSRPGGRPDFQKATQFMALGYRRVKMSEMGSLGLTPPPSAMETADGYVQNGDTQLFVCDAATAARNAADGRSAIEERTTDDATAQELHSAGRDAGGVSNELTTSQTQQRLGPLGA